MTEEMQYIQDELREILDEVVGILKEISAGVPRTVETQAEHCDERLKRCKTVLHSYRIEVRELSKDKQKAYDAKAKGFCTEINKLSTEVKWARANAKKIALMEGARSKNDVSKMTDMELINKGAQTQDERCAPFARPFCRRAYCLAESPTPRR